MGDFGWCISVPFDSPRLAPRGKPFLKVLIPSNTTSNELTTPNTASAIDEARRKIKANNCIPNPMSVKPIIHAATL